MKKVRFAAFIAAFLSAGASAQTPDPLLTRAGWEAGGQLSHYHYEEPGLLRFGGPDAVESVKITGPRTSAVGAYTFVNPKRLYSRFEARISYGSLRYEGSGTQDNIPDTIIEARALIGKDFRPGAGISLSPFAGLGYRYLFDDLRGYSSTGASGYRRFSNYLYVPVGLTARFAAGAEWVVAPTIEYDHFLQGRQHSMLSDAGFGDPDVTNTQNHGRGFRASLMAEKGHWAFGPWMNYWNIEDSDRQPIGGGFAVLEPANWTREYGIEVRYRF